MFHLPEELLKEAAAAVDHGKAIRYQHNFKKTKMGEAGREVDLRLAVLRLTAARKPLATCIRKFPHEPQTDRSRSNDKVIRAAAEAIQAERQKLQKMRKGNDSWR